MLPLSLLRSARGLEIFVELKNGESYNGELKNVDSWMNLTLNNVTVTSKDAKTFTKIKECYLRGNSVKFLRLPNEALEKVKEHEQELQNKNRQNFQGRKNRSKSLRGRAIRRYKKN